MKIKLDEVKYLTNFLWRDFIGAGPHVNLLVDVHTGDDEEHTWQAVRLEQSWSGLDWAGDTWTPGSASQQSPQSEYHGSLVLLRQVSELGIRY